MGAVVHTEDGEQHLLIGFFVLEIDPDDLLDVGDTGGQGIAVEEERVRSSL